MPIRYTLGAEDCAAYYAHVWERMGMRGRLASRLRARVALVLLVVVVIGLGMITRGDLLVYGMVRLALMAAPQDIREEKAGTIAYGVTAAFTAVALIALGIAGVRAWRRGLLSPNPAGEDPLLAGAGRVAPLSVLGGRGGS